MCPDPEEEECQGRGERNGKGGVDLELVPGEIALPEIIEPVQRYDRQVKVLQRFPGGIFHLIRGFAGLFEINPYIFPQISRKSLSDFGENRLGKLTLHLMAHPRIEKSHTQVLRRKPKIRLTGTSAAVTAVSHSLLASLASSDSPDALHCQSASAKRMSPPARIEPGRMVLMTLPKENVLNMEGLPDR
jgi:hypothetical protein